MAAKLTAPDGPFPLAEADVHHHGTVQRYNCWQRGPNSVIFDTLPELYGDTFTRHSDKDFLSYEGDEAFTYGEAISIATALARELAATYKIVRSDCIAIAGRNYPEWVFSFIAATRFLSAVALPVNSFWIGEELLYGLEDSQSKIIIADTGVLSRASFLKDANLPVICMRAGKTRPPFGGATFEDVVAAGKARPSMPVRPVSLDDTCCLMYTSGTTSKPKGVVMTQRGVMSAVNSLKLLKYFDESAAQSVLLLGSPLFHVNGSHVGMLGAIANGDKLVLMYKWNATRALELIQQLKVTNLVGVPTMTYEIANNIDLDKYDTSSLVGVGGGGANFAAAMIGKVASKFKTARAGTGYGMTETNAISVIMPPPLFPARPTSCGIPMPNLVDVCILNDHNGKAQPGEVGEICFRGAGIMKEYWRKPDATAEVFHVDGEGKLWLRTGDIGYLDKDMFVYISDRAKDIIIRGGENISCAEIETALLEHPALADVAAFGVPDEDLGEVVAVAVTLQKGAGKVPIQELKKHAASRLAAFKVPAEYYLWHEEGLPRGATGKTQKREIRDVVANFKKARQESKKIALSKL